MTGGRGAGADRSPVLVTGADGFLGRHVVEALRAAGRPVRRWVLDGEGEVVGDLRQPGLVAGAVEGTRAVVHCAGLINAPDARAFRDVNVAGTRRLGEAAAAAGVGRFVFVSSSDVVFNPSGRYGASKAEAEQALLATFPAGLQRVRPTVIYGPRDRKNVYAMVRLAAIVPSVYPLPGPGAGRRQPIWVGDLARALGAAATSPDPPAPLRHLAGPDRPTVREMVESILAALGLARRIVPVPLGAVLGGLGRAGLSGLLRDHAEQLLSFEGDKAYGDEPGQWTAADGPRTGFSEGLAAWIAAEGAVLAARWPR